VKDLLGWQMMMQSYPRPTVPTNQLLCFFQYCKTFSRVDSRFGPRFYLDSKDTAFPPVLSNCAKNSSKQVP
jgi:hypothetical protein